MLYILTMILIAIICLVLIVIILLQSGQGGGLSGGIAGSAGGGGGGMVGARRTADFLSKSTSVLGAVFLTLCVLANFFIDGSTQEQSTIQRTGVEVPLQPTELELPSQTVPTVPPQESSDNGDNE